MAKITLEQLGPLLRERRGNRGLREIAAQVGISAATLSRIEAGKQPDLETFSKICQWLQIDASELLGCAIPGTISSSTMHTGAPPVLAHFRAAQAMSPETARHLGELILAVQRAVLAEAEEAK